jgi:uncharacterized protein (DUF427 family)
MITASYHGTVLARSAKTICLEGNHYFPQESVTAPAIEKSWLRRMQRAARRSVSVAMRRS